MLFCSPIQVSIFLHLSFLVTLYLFLFGFANSCCYFVLSRFWTMLCSSFLIAFIDQVCIWFLLILCPFVGFYKHLWSLNAANTLFLSLSMSSIVSSILSPTIFLFFGVLFWTKRFWMLVSFPLFAPIWMCFLFSLYLSIFLWFHVVFIICVVAMSRKENLISELHTRKGTWKIVVRITDLWQVRKQNSKQAIEMVLMDQMVIVVLFLLVVISNFYCMWCDFILWFRCFRVQRLVLLSGKNCSLSSRTSYIVVLRIWFRT